MPLIRFVGNLGYVVIAVAGGVFVTQRILAIGHVQAFMQYSRQFGMPITQVAGIVNVLQSTVAAAERVFELLDEEEEAADRPDAKTIAEPAGRIGLHDVSFGYEADQLVLKNLDLAVEPGQLIAIVGPTGAGKTTLVNLLMRFYDVNQGSITFDGHDIRDLKRSSLRTMFGMVLQDTGCLKGRSGQHCLRPGGCFDEEVVRGQSRPRITSSGCSCPKVDTVLTEDVPCNLPGPKAALTIASDLGRFCGAHFGRGDQFGRYRTERLIQQPWPA